LTVEVTDGDALGAAGLLATAEVVAPAAAPVAGPEGAPVETGDGDGLGDAAAPTGEVVVPGEEWAE
jgi:hypothetical protein